MKNTFRTKGFTLIELLVVIVILGILSTISVGTFRNYFAKARDSERVSATQNLAMMIKVGTGGDGGCGVYNATLNLDESAADACTADKTDAYNLDTLIVENDYKMPESKSGLHYYYGFLEGIRSGDNEFFIAIGAEEAKPQNGQKLDKEIEGDDAFIFVDGTRQGIDDSLAGTWAAGGVLDEVTNSDSATDKKSWKLYRLKFSDEGEVELSATLKDA